MTVQLAVALVVAVVLLGFGVGRLVKMWWKFRGDRVVTCPETRRTVGVKVDARHVAATSLAGSPQLRLSSCTRWPERADCGQECLSQVAAAPQDCLVHNILVKWYAGKKCATCGRPVGDIPLAGVKPAVLCADQVSVEWSQIPADQLEETLAAAVPICFACHMGKTMIREHPELVVDRSRFVGRSSSR